MSSGAIVTPPFPGLVYLFVGVCGLRECGPVNCYK